MIEEFRIDRPTPLDDNTQAIHRAVYGLLSGAPDDAKIEVFATIASHAMASFGDEEVFSDFYVDHFNDPRFRRQLLGHPAAVPLLAYVFVALAKFDRTLLRGDASPNDRYRAIASAFGIVQKQGPQGPTTVNKLEVSEVFVEALQRAANGSCLDDLVADPKTFKAARRRAMLETYQHLHGDPGLHSPDTEKDRRTAIVSAIRDSGYGWLWGDSK